MNCLKLVSLESIRSTTGKVKPPVPEVCAPQKNDINKKKARVKLKFINLEFPLPVLFTVKSYSAAIASVGHDATQAPQSTHLSGSIQCLPSFSEIASDGQSLTQEPQFTQVSLILWAIFYLSL
jgi:hypothetical protein